MRRRLLPLLCAALAAGCTSVTEIRSDPPGARVTIDGVERGVTPMMWSERVTVFTRHAVELRAPGYRTAVVRIGADRWNAGKVGAALVALLPLSPLALFVATDYPLAYDVALTPARPSPAVR